MSASDIILLCGLLVSIVGLVFHTREDAATRRKVKKLQKQIREHKCQGGEE